MNNGIQLMVAQSIQILGNTTQLISCTSNYRTDELSQAHTQLLYK